MKVIPESCRVH